jgi:hypothetical protein
MVIAKAESNIGILSKSSLNQGTASTYPGVQWRKS